MSSAFQCDYCHEFTKRDYAQLQIDSIPKVPGKHSRGGIKYEMHVDGVKTNSCKACTAKYLTELAKKVDGLP